MRVRIIGDCDTARDIRSSFGRTDIVVSELGADYIVRVTEGDVELVELNGIDCELERRVANCLEKVAKCNPLLDRLGDIRTDNELGVLIPRAWGADRKRSVRDAICRAIQQMAMPNPPKLPDPKPEPPKPWWKVWG